eukprot:TRINITY_DN11949_c0_g1_i1.p1 TRINITY_DN11949_c0_g1~~TRINITY_DN11949_c0_g1_i1.p1  ORF type:complete len:350 (+),score=36.77 TRINITY_DN11949_c0_g1_i1:72-1052(+)
MEDHDSDQEAQELLSVHIPFTLDDEDVGKERFTSVPTLWAVVLQFIILTSYNIYLFLDVDHFTSIGTKFTPFVFRSILHVFAYFIIMIMKAYTNFFHRRARLAGYLQFYRRSHSLIQIPSYIWSVGNAIVVLIATTWPADQGEEHFSALVALQVLVTVENAITLPCYVIYSYQVVRHNGLKKSPDVTESMFTSHKQFNDINANENDFDEDGDSDLMTKQGEYIRYLEEQKHNLSKQILELSQELENANEHIQSVQAPPPEEGSIEKLMQSKDHEIKSLVTQLYQKDQIIEELQSNTNVVQISANEPEIVAMIERIREGNRRFKVQL